LGDGQLSRLGEVISDAFEAALGTLGVCVTYHRGDDWIGDLDALPGKSEFLAGEGEGVIVDYRSRDFLMRACDLVIDGEVLEPKRGDLIKETAGKKIHTYEVMRPDGGEQVFRYSDTARTIVRVHAKLKATVNR
jgi:hypothetical protein